MVRGGLNFKVDYKMDIKRVHRGVTMEYFNWLFLAFKRFRHVR